MLGSNERCRQVELSKMQCISMGCLASKAPKSRFSKPWCQQILHHPCARERFGNQNRSKQAGSENFLIYWKLRFENFANSKWFSKNLHLACAESDLEVQSAFPWRAGTSCRVIWKVYSWTLNQWKSCKFHVWEQRAYFMRELKEYARAKLFRGRRSPCEAFNQKWFLALQIGRNIHVQTQVSIIVVNCFSTRRPQTRMRLQPTGTCHLFLWKMVGGCLRRSFHEINKKCV